MKKCEFIERYGLEAYQRRLEKCKQYYQVNKVEKAEYQKQWREANKTEIAEYHKQYYQQHKAEKAEYDKQRYQQHKVEKAEYNKQYNKQYLQTPMGRANNLVNAYKTSDKNHNRGECTLTPQWVVDNIFSSKCIYCGESDWKQLGCDRVDNNLPHTEDNVVCCCCKCNRERQKTEFDVFLKMKKVC